jgi:hypothetical protein
MLIISKRQMEALQQAMRAEFIGVQAVAGENFDSDPRFAAARVALTDATLSPGDRLARARRCTSEAMAATAGKGRG